MSDYKLSHWEVVVVISLYLIIATVIFKPQLNEIHKEILDLRARVDLLSEIEEQNARPPYRYIY